jgi:hypothetical protein
MKKLLGFSFFMLFSMGLFAQNYGNEWINFNQDYFKIKIGKEGIYRIAYSELQSAGFPVTTVNPRNIQLWIQGKEQPIIISDESDNKFDPGDYIEFYGTYNNGTLDSSLYIFSEQQPHTYMSLYSDTSVYFLTISSSAFGRRIDLNNDNNYAGKKADPYFLNEQVIWYNNKNKGQSYDGLGFSTEGFHSEYTEGEGWALQLDGNGTKVSFLTPHLFTTGPKPYLEMLAHTRANNTSAYDVDGANNGLQLTYDPSGTLINSKKVRGLGRYLFQDSLAISFIGKTTTTFKLTSYLLSKSIHSLAYSKLIYPRLFNLNDSSRFKFRYNSANNFIRFAKYPNGKTKPLVYDISNFTKSYAEVIGGELYCNLSNLSSDKLIYISDETQVINLDATSIESTKFKEIALVNSFDYLIISNERLDSGANAYKDYLSSSTGGNFKPYLAFVNDIYDQFYFGQKHPMAIKNFCRYAITTTPSLKYLLLLGKGQKYINSRFNPTVSRDFDLVPTYGIPPTDYFFVTGYNGSALNPLLITGRVPASNNKQIANYLEKLSDLTLNGYQPWKKKVLQLAGGNNSTEVEQFSNYHETYYNIISRGKWGATRKLITKQDPSPVDSSLKSKIQKEINTGYALIDYFGHGSTQASDIDLGDAYQLNNIDKYPFFYFNGCGLGNTFDGGSIAEDFLFSKDKGAIGWMAGTTFGYISELYYFAILFHQNLADSTHVSFAGNIKKSIETYQDPFNNYNRAQCRQMLFMGEPSAKIFEATLPDFAIDASKSYITPRKATAEVDSFGLVLYLENLALNSADSFTIKVSQTLPGGKIISNKAVIKQSFADKDTFVYWIKKAKGTNLTGLSTFNISIDTANAVAEQLPLGESNNTATLQHYFSSSNAQILFPRKNGIVSSPNVELIAQSLIYVKSNFNFIFEIDTVPDFTSPFKKNSGNVSAAYIAKTNFTLLSKDSIDYFWRVKIDDGSVNSNWDVSTFSMINGSPQGWSQGYYSKFVETPKQQLVYDTLRRMEFITTQSLPYIIETSGQKSSATYRTIWHEGYPLYFGYLTNGGILVVAINPKNEERFCIDNKYNVTSAKSPWWGAPNNYLKKYFETPGVSKSCSYFFNTYSKTDRDSFVYLLQQLPPDYHLMVMTGPVHNMPNWEKSVFDELAKFGAIRANSVKEGEPYILVGQKGMLPGKAIEKLSDPTNPLPGNEQYIFVNTTLNILSDSGQMSSGLIGPATQWKSFYRTLKVADNPYDVVKFNLYGITGSGNSQVLFKNISDRETDLSGVDASLYPYLKIEATIKDSLEKTPTEVARWTVLFEGLPEGTINPLISLYQNKDTLDVGDTLKVKVAYSNISTVPMDSVMVLITSTNALNEVDTLELKNYKKLIPSDNFIVNKEVLTENLEGQHLLRISVNPEMAQPEEYLFNNIWEFPYLVNTDQFNPFLDVVFDGRHITNLEIVSPNPVITITAVDENKYRLMDDPTYFKVKIKYPGTSSFVPLNVLSDSFSFVPSNGPNQKSKLIFMPQNLKDGIYELAVSVMDAQGNLSSNEDYKIAFQVISKATITNVYPYPNPFTTKTKFVFTLTGEKVPDYFKITIITITGTIVKEITMDELGPLNIGNNVTQYEWLGTDNFGDKLANGTYLYKVTAKVDGKDIEMSESAGDAYFKNGFGKLYIMR